MEFLFLFLFKGFQIIHTYVKLNKTLLLNELPLLNTSLSEFCICMAGLTNEVMIKFGNLIKTFGGKYASDLEQDVNCLVVGHAKTRKVEIARTKKINIVSLEWLTELYQTKKFHEPNLFPFKPLIGAKISLSGFALDVKKLIYERAECLGANLSNFLNKDFTHLLVDVNNINLDPERKYYAAKLWSIPVVSLGWLDECESEVLWVSENKYLVDVGMNVKNLNSNGLNGLNEKNLNLNGLNENSINSNGLDENSLSLNNSEKNLQNNLKPQFNLHGINIMIIGSSIALRKYSIIINDANGKIITFVQHSSIVVFCMESYSFYLESTVASQILSLPPEKRPHLLSSEWIDECIQTKTLADKNNYFLQINPSTFCVTNLKIAPNFYKRQNPDQSNQLEWRTSKRQNNGQEILIDEIHLFDGKLFLIHKIASQKLISYIKSHGGQVFENLQDIGQTDKKNSYILCAHGTLFQNPPFPLVTIQWLEDCVLNKKILDPQEFAYLYSPLPFEQSHYQISMNSVCICTASMEKEVKRHLKILAVIMGVNTFHENLIPKKTTHLITNSYKGAKQEKARILGIHVVYVDWLYKCSEIGYKADENSFVVVDKNQFQNYQVDDLNNNSQFNDLNDNVYPVSKNNNNLDSNFKNISIEVQSIFQDVVFCIEQSLSNQYEELYNKAISMGATNSWNLDLSVTHYITQGKNSKKKSNSKLHYVSPEWIFQSFKQNQRLSETLFPAEMDPKFLLSITIEANGGEKPKIQKQILKKQKNIKTNNNVDEFLDFELLESNVEKSKPSKNNSNFKTIEKIQDSFSEKGNFDFNERIDKLIENNDNNRNNNNNNINDIKKNIDIEIQGPKKIDLKLSTPDYDKNISKIINDDKMNCEIEIDENIKIENTSQTINQDTKIQLEYMRDLFKMLPPENTKEAYSFQSPSRSVNTVELSIGSIKFANDLSTKILPNYTNEQEESQPNEIVFQENLDQTFDDSQPKAKVSYQTNDIIEFTKKNLETNANNELNSSLHKTANDEIEKMARFLTTHDEIINFKQTSENEKKLFKSPHNEFYLPNINNQKTENHIQAKEIQKICVYFSGFSSTIDDTEQKKKLKEMAEKIGLKVSKGEIWTHFVTKNYKKSDKTIVSLSLGKWILKIQWIEDSYSKGEILKEDGYEWKSKRHKESKMDQDPSLCRKTVSKIGHGLFKDLKILYAYHDQVWKDILISCGAQVFDFDQKNPPTLTTLMEFNFVLTSNKKWFSFDQSTKKILGKISVIVPDFFLDYLCLCKEPEPKIFYPNL